MTKTSELGILLIPVTRIFETGWVIVEVESDSSFFEPAGCKIMDENS
ncbi:hypothetical protein MNBD_NITROSPINAE03-156 [hydrothermal vent metagenome]|uniref:Uncharacterized protein n=1 Tax=hydrothermal vent metagenome TaxID=652676 RepID=A0A3B1BVV3_9ZZZZ